MIRHVIFPLLFLTIVPAVAVALEVGDHVVAVEAGAAYVGPQLVSSVPIGGAFTVGAIEGDWVWLNTKIPGWVEAKNVRHLDDAVTYFNRETRNRPTWAEGWFGSASVHAKQENWQAAVDDYSKAIELSPESSFLYVARGYAHHRLDHHEQAISDYDKAMVLAPHDIQSLRLKAAVHITRADYDQAIDLYNQAAKVNPYDVALNNDRAWLLATCPDESYRNGAQAVRDATLACEMSRWKVHNRLSTLAAAYAENQQYGEAVRMQIRAIELTPASALALEQERLAQYLAGQPSRDVAWLTKK